MYNFAMPESLNRLKRSFEKLLPYTLKTGDTTLLRRELRWRLTNRQVLERWTEQRLQVAPDFWLFIAGCNNSGTTLLERLLSNHPDLRSLPYEGQRLTVALPNPTHYPNVPRNFTIRAEIFRWKEMDHPANAPRVRYDWAYYYKPRPGILLNKSPHHSLRALWLQRHFQPARFLFIIREPYAVCEGIRRRMGYSIATAATHWVKVHEYILEDLPHLDRNLIISYEQLCQSPKETLDQIQFFMNLDQPFDSATWSGPLNVHNLHEHALTLASLNDQSRARLSPADLDTINQIAGPMLGRLGYSPLSANR